MSGDVGGGGGRGAPGAGSRRGAPGAGSRRGPSGAGEAVPTASGAGRVLVAVYGVFALAATARAAVQLATKYHQAPLAYLLSAVSGVVYVVATAALATRGPLARRLAWVAVSTELAGVLVIGTFSLLAPEDFPRATVWSLYGIGYGFVPLVLPFVGLAWLRRTSARRAPGRTAGEPPA